MVLDEGIPVLGAQISGQAFSLLPLHRRVLLAGAKKIVGSDPCLSEDRSNSTFRKLGRVIRCGSASYDKGQVRAFDRRRKLRDLLTFGLRFQETTSDITGNLESLGDRPALGDEALDVVGRGEIDTLRKPELLIECTHGCEMIDTRKPRQS